MRKVLIFCTGLLIILLISPALAVFTTDNKTENIEATEATSSTKEENTENKAEQDDVINLALSYIEEDFCNEAIKAALCIAENNIKYNGENNIKITSTKTDFSESLINKVHKLCKETDAEISYNGKNVFIPTSSLSEGFTKTSEKYPYIKPVASPWDCYDKDYVYGKEYSVGISMNGIDYLCKEGLSYKDALSWYLPDFEIK